VVFLVKPECCGVEKGLIIPGAGYMPYSGFLEKRPDPIIVTREVGSSLISNRGLILVIAGHGLFFPLPVQ
jgi:hypothetical protein